MSLSFSGNVDDRPLLFQSVPSTSAAGAGAGAGAGADGVVVAEKEVAVADAETKKRVVEHMYEVSVV